ncbi:hypothetical protein, partial [Rhodococcus sp. NPDC058514]|uniref:hypothetical protein n=1 Tax=Rhodococcus sp. NPDC058514 TaxID=3346532 RepID=UPI00364A596A
MNQGQETGPLLTRYVAGPETVGVLVRAAVADLWSRPKLWLILLGLPVLPVLPGWRSRRRLGESAFGIGDAVLTYLAFLALVLVVAGVVTMLLMRRHRANFGRFAFPGVALSTRFGRDGFEIVTPVESSMVPFARIGTVAVRGGAVVLRFVDSKGVLIAS